MRFRRENEDEAHPVVWDLYWLSRAATKGHRGALYLYADLLMDMPFPVKDCDKALKLYEEFEQESRKVGKDYAVAYAKIESGIILCEGLRLENRRNPKRGVELIDEGLGMMKKINEKPNASQLYRLGEMYALGYAQENEVQSATDIEKAIEFLEEFKRGNFNPNGAGLNRVQSEYVDKYLNHWKSWLTDKIKLEQDEKAFTEDTIKLGCQEAKHIYDEGVRDIRDIRTKKRREEAEQSTEKGWQIENALRQLQERF